MPSDPILDSLDDLDSTYARLHTAKEDAFWTAMMGLGGKCGFRHEGHHARCEQ